ncbi:hypothetical protein [Streptomyces cellulosae]|uniref:Uncharacterized protein n=1 Tax=Streptomyces cellulosae TaxID=1968 RepID=A0ABW7YC78_STRCE
MTTPLSTGVYVITIAVLVGVVGQEPAWASSSVYADRSGRYPLNVIRWPG